MDRIASTGTVCASIAVNNMTCGLQNCKVLGCTNREYRLLGNQANPRMPKPPRKRYHEKNGRAYNESLKSSRQKHPQITIAYRGGNDTLHLLPDSTDQDLSGWWIIGLALRRSAWPKKASWRSAREKGIARRTEPPARLMPSRRIPLG